MSKKEQEDEGFALHSGTHTGAMAKLLRENPVFTPRDTSLEPMMSKKDLISTENYLINSLCFDTTGQKIYICTEQVIIPNKVLSMWYDPRNVTIEEGFIFRKEKRKYRHINVFGQYIADNAAFMKCKDIEKSPCFVRYKEPLDNSPSEEKIEL